MYGSEIITIIVSGITSVLTGTSVAVFMRSKYRAEVAKIRAEARKIQEEVDAVDIENSDKLVELYKKIYTDLTEKLRSDNREVLAMLSTIKVENKNLKETIELLSNENVQLTKVVRKLERAVKNSNSCPHSRNCPIMLELQNQKGDVQSGTKGKPTTNRQHTLAAEINGKAGSSAGIKSENKPELS